MHLARYRRRRSHSGTSGRSCIRQNRKRGPSCAPSPTLGGSSRSSTMITRTATPCGTGSCAFNRLNRKVSTPKVGEGVPRLRKKGVGAFRIVDFLDRPSIHLEGLCCNIQVTIENCDARVFVAFDSDGVVSSFDRRLSRVLPAAFVSCDLLNRILVQFRSL